MLNYQSTTEKGIVKCTIDLESLYNDSNDRRSFENRWSQFYETDRLNNQIFKRENNHLTYLSESLIPDKNDNRPPLLLLFGNPASQSVVSKMCFAFEGNKREHRIWKVFRQSKLLEFASDSFIENREYEVFQMNQIRKHDFFELDYESPFRIGIDVFFTFPSPASTPIWSGVAGVKKLFGNKAIRKIEFEESKRICNLIKNFVNKEGTIISFQKDAYEGLRSDDSPFYSLELAKKNKLIGRSSCDKSIILVGAPPTRYAHSRVFYQFLIDTQKRFL